MSGFTKMTDDKTLTLKTLIDYFEMNRSKWSKTQKRLIESITDEMSDADKKEIYDDLYEELAPAKKKRGKKKVEKSPEEIEKALREAQLGRYNKIMNEMKTVIEGEDIEVEAAQDLFSLLSPEQRKEYNMAVKDYKRKIGMIYHQKLLSKRGGKKVNPDYIPLEGSRVRTDLDNGVNHRKGYTGESVKVEFPNKPVEDYKVIDMKVLKGWGIELDEGEAAIWNQSGEVNQVKFKRGYVDRAYPLNEVRAGGCPCSIKFDRQKHIYALNDDGVYEKVEKDWGCIPCNLPVEAGGVCKRHGKSQKHFDVWTRDDLKIPDDKIVEYFDLMKHQHKYKSDDSSDDSSSVVSDDPWDSLGE